VRRHFRVAEDVAPEVAHDAAARAGRRGREAGNVPRRFPIATTNSNARARPPNRHGRGLRNRRSPRAGSSRPQIVTRCSSNTKPLSPSKGDPEEAFTVRPSANDGRRRLRTQQRRLWRRVPQLTPRARRPPPASCLGLDKSSRFRRDLPLTANGVGRRSPTPFPRRSRFPGIDEKLRPASKGCRK
jgi:hypothetical protein